MGTRADRSPSRYPQHRHSPPQRKRHFPPFDHRRRENAIFLRSHDPKFPEKLYIFFLPEKVVRRKDNGREDSGSSVAANSSEELHHATSTTLPGTIECCAVHGQTRCSGSATRQGISANWVRACAGNGTIRSEFRPNCPSAYDSCRIDFGFLMRRML